MSSQGIVGRKQREKRVYDETHHTYSSETERLCKRISHEQTTITWENFSDQVSVYYKPEKNNKKLYVKIIPKNGLWEGGSFEFRIFFTIEYPQRSPSIVCLTPIWHPNIDIDGKCCTNILRLDWKSTYGIELLLHSLLSLFLEPNPYDYLNKEASQDMLLNQQMFESRAKSDSKKAAH